MQNKITAGSLKLEDYKALVLAKNLDAKEVYGVGMNVVVDNLYVRDDCAVASLTVNGNLDCQDKLEEPYT